MPAPTVWSAARDIALFAQVEGRSSVSASPDGRFAVFWNGGQGNGDILNYVFDAGGAAADQIISVGVYNAAAQQAAVSAFLTDGRLVLAWVEAPTVGGDQDIKFRVMNSAADSYSTVVDNVVANAGATTGQQVSPLVAALSNGNFVISWVDVNDNKKKARIFNVAGVAVTGAFNVDPATTIRTASPDPAVVSTNITALAGGGFAITYEDIGGNNLFSIFNNLGTSVITDAGTSPAGSVANAVIQLADGRLAIIGERYIGNGYTIQFFNTSGSALGTSIDFVLPGAANSNSGNVRATALQDGRFMVVSSAYVEGIVGADVWGAVFKADGTIDGAAFAIANTADIESAPAIATLADGRVVVTWTDSTVNAGDIYQKIYDPRETGVALIGSSGGDSYIGTGNQDYFYGGAGNDKFVGAGGVDVLIGGNGDDNLDGGIGGDVLVGDGGNDTLYGGADNDTLYGGLGNDLLYGGIGDDLLVGNEGSNIMAGGAGNDLYYASGANDVINEAVGEGYDTVFAYANLSLAAGSEVEYVAVQGVNGLTIQGSTYSNLITGNVGNDTLTGGIGNDVIHGYSGANTLAGGLGDDTYFVSGVNDVVTELAGQGNDTINAYANFTLAATSEIETINCIVSGLTITGSDTAQYFNGSAGADTIYGGGGNDTLYGASGSDFLYGGAGNDTLFGVDGTNTMAGGIGDDIYYVQGVNDIINENAGEGFDTAYIYSNFALTGTAAVEVLNVQSATGISVTGSSIGQTIYGNAGNDRIDGGGGLDTVYGGAGNDAFVFSNAPNGSNEYTFGDFASGQDKLEISAIIFGGGLVAGFLNSSQFQVDPGSNGVATFAQERFIYDSTIKVLFYDADGSGGVSTAKAIASFQGSSTAPVISDFLIK